MALKDILAIIVSAAAVIGIAWKAIGWTRAITEGIRCQLRSDITRTYYRHLDDKVLRQYEFEALSANFRAYKALNGNSFIDKIWSEINDNWTVTT